MGPLAAVILAAATTSAPGEQTPVLVVRIGVELVQIDAVVTDKRGRPITDLRAADFEVLQDGRLQVVTQAAFMGSAALPSVSSPVASSATPGNAVPPSAPPEETLVFVVDDLTLSLAGVDATRRALLAFADRMEGGAPVFLLRTCGRGVDLRPVGGPAELRARARALRYGAAPLGLNDPDRMVRSRLDFQAQATSAYLNGLLVHQSLLSLQDVTDALRSWRGRKTLVLFSEGFPIWHPSVRGGGAPLDAVYRRGEDVLDEVDRLADLANRASIVIHTVDPRGLVPGGISAADSIAPDGGSASSIAQFHAEARGTLSARHQAIHSSQGSLARVAEWTGGLSVLNSNDIASGVARIVADSRAYYLVGYEPAPATFARDRPRFHRLEVRVKRPGLKVRSRKGFFGMSDATVSALAPPQPF